MNIFSLLFIVAAMGLLFVGAVLLVIAIVKRKWKLAAIAVAIPVVGYASMAAIGLAIFSLLDIRLEREVADSEVIGVWTLRTDGVERAVREGYQPPDSEPLQVEFRADGTFSFRSIRSFPVRREELRGTWRIQPDYGEDDIFEIYMLSDTKSAFTISFTEQDGRLVLWEYWDDPDTGALLEYDKQPNPERLDGAQPPS